MKPIVIAQGNLPLITFEVMKADWSLVDVTGATVEFAFQGRNPPGVGWVHPGAVVDGPSGQVSYQFAGTETQTPGDYAAQWRITLGGTTTLYPLDCDVLKFRIRAALPASVPAGASPGNIVAIPQMYELVRSVLGSGIKRSDEAIASVCRTCLRLGKVPGQALQVDYMGITPGLTTPKDIGLLTYHAAKMFVMPEAADYRYETRAMSERFGRQDHFVRDLENAIYELEDGAMFYSMQNFYGWVNSLTGVDVWSIMSDMTVTAPVATVNIGRAGVTVSST